MKIGIITWLIYENYGTKLQAIALSKVLKEKYNVVSNVNFLPPDFEKKASNNNFVSKIYDKIDNWLFKIIKKIYSNKIEIKKIKMKKIVEEMCDVTELIDSDIKYIEVVNQYDVLVFGSDQIWNPEWHHKYYYGDLEGVSSKKVSYAPSLGISFINDENKRKIKESLKQFACITCREKSGKDILQSLTSIEVKEVLDPTFLLNSREWDKILNVKERIIKNKYVFYYFLSFNKHHYNAVKKYAKKEKKELVLIPQSSREYFVGNKKIIDAGVVEFVNLIKYAEIVFTDSFHGTVFSLIYNKTFCVFERFSSKNLSSQNSRIYDLLSKVDIKDKIVEFNTSNLNHNKFIELTEEQKNKMNLYIEESKDILFSMIDR